MRRGADIAGGLSLFALALASAALIHASTTSALDDARRMRVALDARAALADREAPRDGPLTVVRRTESAKYFFLNKKSYLVHTSSAAREGTVLRGDDPIDKARADRDGDARRKQSALAERLADGSWRVTIADGALTAEIHGNPKPIEAPAPWGPLGGALFAGLALALILRRWRGPGWSYALGAILLGLGGAWAMQVSLQTASTLATAFLAEGGRSAPAVRFPPLPLLGSAALLLLGSALSALVAGPLGARAARAFVRDRQAYGYAAPAMIGLAVLVGIPFLFGIALSLFHHQHGQFSFVGLKNFVDILGAPGEGFKPQTLPYSLVMTVVWTALNVSLHLLIGLALALILKRHASGATRIYRVILIVPWAVPSYLTALIWRSMFDADVGAINRILGTQGLSWMNETSTAFVANLVTNVWLGVPFMMVVCLGALSSIPQDLYEAAEVDGASRVDQLVRITLPLLKPALLPAVLLGSIWTFNKFEVIYLVSEGRPDGATDILVTESYRWAFERGLAQGGAYGYAAAYSVIIFVVLLLYGWMTSRVTRAAEEALR